MCSNRIKKAQWVKLRPSTHIITSQLLGKVVFFKLSCASGLFWEPWDHRTSISATLPSSTVCIPVRVCVCVCVWTRNILAAQRRERWMLLTIESFCSLVARLRMARRGMEQKPAVLKVHFTSPPERGGLVARPLIDCWDHWSNFEAFWILSPLSLLFVRSWINLISPRHMQRQFSLSGENRGNK